ncbi:MAG: MerR family transcriptional regulator [Acidimicrobiales bacterium]
MARRNEFSGPEAADLAGVTYRQIDYWARQGWVVPSQVSPDAVHRRLYSEADVVRVAALGHLGRSRIDVRKYAMATGAFVCLRVGASSSCGRSTRDVSR